MVVDIVPAKNLKLWYGRAECRWEDLTWALHALSIDLDNPVARSPASAAIMIADELRKRYQTHGKITYTEMLHASRNFDCTYLRDRVFASMNISGVKSTDTHYTLRPMVFYIDTAIMINHEIFPASLSMIEDKRTSAELSSWVPNFMVPVQRKMLIQTGHRFSASSNHHMPSIINVVSSAENNLYDTTSGSFSPKGFVTDTIMDVLDYNPVRQWYDERNLEALNNSFMAMWFDSVMLTVLRGDEIAKER